MRIISFLYELLFNVKSPRENHNQEELFHSDIFLRPNKINFKVCPQCKKKAKTNKDIIDFFGIKKSNGKTQIQSWCKACRKQVSPSPEDTIKQQEMI